MATTSNNDKGTLQYRKVTRTPQPERTLAEALAPEVVLALVAVLPFLAATWAWSKRPRSESEDYL